MKSFTLLAFCAIMFVNCKPGPDQKNETSLAEHKNMEVAEAASVEITPVSHATMVLNWDDTVIYIDPVGGATAFEGQPAADLVLVTDIHGDHLNVETLEAVVKDNTPLVVPQAVAEKLPESLKSNRNVLANGQQEAFKGFKVEAVPMYNLREEAKDFHVKGRGNGYVLEKGGKRLYISGDTEDIPEMRNLADIDMAFVCMNLPYTMTVQSAADAVVDFAPKKVYPYHYRGSEGLSDVDEFARLVAQSNKPIEVVQLDWYPNRD